METVDDGHRFRFAYHRKHLDTQMHNGDTFALNVVRERYLRRQGTENMGSPEFTEGGVLRQRAPADRRNRTGP
eukprot:jgi/Tetstr1/466209/TSEL_010767.t1